MQLKIPQNVQMEDKIVGPLTLKQLIIVGAGGGFDYFLYLSLAKLYVLTVWIFPVAIIGIITLAVAFLKIQGIPFIQYAFLSLEFYFKPRHRVWTQGGAEVFVSITQPKPKTKDQLAKEKQDKAPPKDISKLDELTEILDTHSQLLEDKHDALQEVIQHP
tara:strand:- start:517 stop:996 length:480 start_codon:yes stop_codon:yes gene_type:complete